jgi:predicted negative regulator of RcsB-dependent stress response
LTRHELKELQQDQFATKVVDAVGFVSSHRSSAIRWTLIVLAVVLLAGGGYRFYALKRAERQAELREAFQIMEASAGAQASPYTKNFNTVAERDAASLKALSQFAAKYSGSKEGYLAQYYVAILRNTNGDTPGAIAMLREVAGSGYSVASLAKVSLANLLAGEGKYAEAEQILRSMVDKPTDLVSKKTAQVLLARVIGLHDSKAARALLASIENGKRDPEHPAVVRAIQLVGAELNQ